MPSSCLLQVDDDDFLQVSQYCFHYLSTMVYLVASDPISRFLAHGFKLRSTNRFVYWKNVCGELKLSKGEETHQQETSIGMS